MHSNMKRFLIPLLSATFAAGAALAQTGQWVEIDDDVQVPQLGASADDVDDWDVYAADGTEIGEVDEVIGPDSSTPMALVIEFEGGSDYGDRDDVIVPLEHFSREGQQLVLNADPQTVSEMETYDG